MVGKAFAGDECGVSTMNRRRQGLARFAAILLLVLPCGGCRQLDQRLFDMNMGLATHVFQPVSRAYQKVVPKPIRSGLRNVSDNLRYTDVMVQNALQGKVDRAFSDAGRMAINWVCFFGLFDAATDIGIPKYDEDFGQTLGFHGVAPGPYFNMPFFGPTTLRDVWQYPARIATNPMTWGVDNAAITWTTAVVTYFFQRFDDVENLDPVLEAVDPYEFTKKAFLERREFLIHDGNPPKKAEDDAEIDEALEGLEDLEDGDMEGLDDFEGLDDLEESGDEGTNGDLDDLEGLDDLEDEGAFPGEDGGAAGPERVEGLPPPKIIRRSERIRDVIGPRRRTAPGIDWSQVETPKSSNPQLPPPVVRKR